MDQETPLGYASVVHQGPQIAVTIWRAPAEYVVPNLLLFMLVSLLLTIRWIVPAGVLHLVLMAFWAYDPYLLQDVIESWHYRHFLSAEVSRGPHDVLGLFSGVS